MAADAAEALYRFLDAHTIPYQRAEHPAVYTCEEARQHVPTLPGARLKNLFLCDDKGRRHFLLVVDDETSVDLGALAGRLGVKKLRFGSAARLERLLGVEAGAVTVLALLNDRDRAVEPFLDAALRSAEALQCHPLVNTATVVLARDDLARFLAATGHPLQYVDVPRRDA